MIQPIYKIPYPLSLFIVLCLSNACWEHHYSDSQPLPLNVNTIVFKTGLGREPV